jgi:endoglucanase
MITRRNFIGACAGAAAAALVPGLAAAGPRQPRIPRWRGFNLQGDSPRHPGISYSEQDLDWMAGWGFNFSRFPLSYWSWSDPAHWMQIRDDAFAGLDKGIAMANARGIHVNLCIHRIPGYCVNGRELEPHKLFDSPEGEMQLALEAAVHHWEHVARRYQSVPADRLSFDLMNEPPFMADHARYVTIVRALVRAIRAVSPDRLIFVDGADIGQTPVMALAGDGLVQSTRGYLPKMVSHYTATWVPPREFESRETPTWPMLDRSGARWDRERLRWELITKWKPLTDLGVPVHVGEWGCFNRTPHAAALGWMTDLLYLWREAGWGWSMWNLRGSFGVVDSERADVAYEDFHGHKLDRRMLELLLAG